ncbi:MAG: PadR family transcriptional regulator [Anaerolineales bacterium]|nr:PadR family transcriptional regulator [Anaerolineales bacterium]
MEADKATKKFEKEMKSGTASLVLLSILAKAEEPLYGYLIARRLETETGGEPLIKQGALYPVLRSLEGSSLLSSEVEASTSGPPRRYYRITRQGRETLVAWKGIWDSIRNFVEVSLEGVGDE